MQGSFFFSCIWAMGGTLEARYREQFSIMFRGLLEKEFPIALMNEFQMKEPVPAPLKPYIFVMPKHQLVFDYRFLKEVRKSIRSAKSICLILIPKQRKCLVRFTYNTKEIFEFLSLSSNHFLVIL